MFVIPKSAGFIVSVFALLHGNLVLSQQYCDIASCSSRQHTLCRYPNSGPGPNCQGYVASPLTSAEKTSIVKRHNDLRQTVAQGRETRGSNGAQPRASNMKQVEWDDEVAQVAQRWADQCLDGHDSCRNLPRFSVGQNVWTQWGGSPSVLNGPIADAVNSWYNEVSMFDKNNIQPFRFDYKTGHYTQVVWATTSRVGCARVRFLRNGQYYRTLTCNYGPAGNYINDALYKIGPPASACPNGQSTIAGLCK